MPAVTINMTSAEYVWTIKQATVKTKYTTAETNLTHVEFDPYADGREIARCAKFLRRSIRVIHDLQP